MKTNNYSISTITSTIPKPTLQQFINIYSAYTYFGKNGVKIAGTTSLIDGALAHNFAIEKNYFTLSAFWGNIAYQAMNKVSQSDVISNKYKLAVKFLVASIATGLVYKGSDLFQNKHDIHNTIDNVSLSARLFDEHNAIAHVQESFKESYSSGLHSVWQNLNTLLSNKFIVTALAKQGVDLGVLIFTQKFLSLILPTSKVDIFNAHKNGEAFSLITKKIILLVVQQVVNKIHLNAVKKIESGVKEEVSEKMATLILKEENSQKIMKLGASIGGFSNDISILTNNTNAEIGSIISGFALPLIYSTKSDKEHDFASIITSYPILILLNSLTLQLLSPQTFFEMYKYLKSFVTSESDSEKVTVLNPRAAYEESTSQKMGGMTISMVSNPENYTYTIYKK